jgi:hypothetical protein
VIRLPGDVLFAFGSAELSPAAQEAIAAVDDEIGSGGTGTVTIEGHTDAIGGDADNQALSERRAAAVRSAVEKALGLGYQYRSVGFGEARPVAPNTRPDGSDDPDGRALNRRVEIRTGSAEPGPPPTLEPLQVKRDLADAGLRADVSGLERRRGYLMARVPVNVLRFLRPTCGRGGERRHGARRLRPDRADPCAPLALCTFAGSSTGRSQDPARGAPADAMRVSGFDGELRTPGARARCRPRRRGVQARAVAVAACGTAR